MFSQILADFSKFSVILFLTPPKTNGRPLKNSMVGDEFVSFPGHKWLSKWSKQGAVETARLVTHRVVDEAWWFRASLYFTICNCMENLIDAII